MKLVYLNVWGDEMRDGLISYIEEEVIDTDIFCFQEATDDMKRNCAHLLSDYHEISDYKYISDHDEFPQSIFVKNNIDIVSSGTLLDKTAADYGLAIYVEVKTTEGTLYVCNVHGTAQPKDKLDSPGRIRQSKEIIEFFKDKNGPIIIGGDFNIELNINSVKLFEDAGYKNLIRDYGIDTTRNNLAWKRFPVKMYYSDYVFTNEQLEVKNFSVPKNEISDHLPLIVEVSL